MHFPQHARFRTVVENIITAHSEKAVLSTYEEMIPHLPGVKSYKQIPEGLWPAAYYLAKGLQEVKTHHRDFIERILQPEKEKGVNISCLVEGKGIRPLLGIISYAVNSQFHMESPTRVLPQDLIDAFTALETYHVATLCHDDVIDNSPLRRDRPTIHSQLSRETALRMGTYLLAEGSMLVSDCRFDFLRISLAQALEEITHGASLEAKITLDLPHLTVEDITEKIVDRYIYDKTVPFLVYPLRAGARFVSEARYTGRKIPRSHIVRWKNWAIFGKRLGYLYQLVDDLLDATGTVEETGKETAHDLGEGKVNKPIYETLHHPAIPKLKQEYILNLLRHSREKHSPSDISAAYAIIQEFGVPRLLAHIEKNEHKLLKIMNTLSKEAVERQLLLFVTHALIKRKR